MQMSMGEIAAILGTTSRHPHQIVRGYSLDSRRVGKDQLFFAIRGPRFDGHQFVQQALASGAAGAVVESKFLSSAPVTLAPLLLAVSDPTAALQQLAQAVRRKWAKPIVAITGSTGKTTTKEMAAAILAKKFPVLKSQGNLNNDYGLPLTLLQLESAHEAAVVELAMSAAGEIARLAQIAEPQVGVVTNVAPVHLQFFDSVEAIALAKRELIENLPATGTAVLNLDDYRVRKFADSFHGRVVTFGFENGASLRAVDIRPAGHNQNQFRVVGMGIDADFRLPLPGRHNVQNALAAIATGRLFEISPGDLQSALAQFQNLHQRSEVLTLPSAITILNDSYNSNPLAMEKMLDTLAGWEGAMRRIVVAGEMLELGPTSPQLHKNVGARCVKSGADWLIAVEGDARFILEGALEAGLPEERGVFYNTALEAGRFCAGLLSGGDVVLVKGSRGVHLEKVIELLLSHEEMQPANSSGGPKN